MLCRDLLDDLVVAQRFERHLGFKLLYKLPAFRHARIPSKVRIRLSQLSSILGPLQTAVY